MSSSAREVSSTHKIIALTVIVLAALSSVGYHQADEHFQILEFAAYKLGYASTEDLAWEFEERMRPALQPAIAYALYTINGWGGEADPFRVAFLLRLLSGAFTLAVMLLLCRRYASVSHRWWVWAVLLHWIAIYNGVRFSGENWSGLFATLGFLLYPLRVPDRSLVFTPDAPTTSGSPRRLTSLRFGCGFLFGLAFLCRYQLAILVVAFLFWLLLIGKESWKSLALVATGGLSALLLAYPLSYWLYGEWTLPAWNYLHANLIEGKAATYGTAPWWDYLEKVFTRGIPPLSLVYLGSFFLFGYHYRRDPVAWMTVGFVVVHSLLARKDIRFFYPLLPLFPVLLLGAVAASGRYFGRERGKKRRWRRPIVGLLWVTNFVLLASVVVRPAASELYPLRYIYRNYLKETTLFGPRADLLVAEGATSRWYDRPERYRKRSTEAGQAVTCSTLNCLYLTKACKGTPPPEKARLVYTNRPDWGEAVNFFGWVDQQRWFYVYELDPRPRPTVPQ